MMNLANIRPGGKYLVVDDASGLIVSSMLARMGGKFRHPTVGMSILIIHFKGMESC